MPQALSFVSEPSPGIMISSSSNTRFGGDIPGGPLPCNILNNNSLPAWGNMSYSNRMYCDRIPLASQLCTSREMAFQYKSCHSLSGHRHSQLQRSSEWGVLSNEMRLPPAILGPAAFPSPVRPGRYTAFWRTQRLSWPDQQLLVHRRWQVMGIHWRTISSQMPQSDLHFQEAS